MRIELFGVLYSPVRFGSRPVARTILIYKALSVGNAERLDRRFLRMENIEIKFATDEWYDHHRRKIVWFTASVDGKRIDCGISIEALGDHFGAYYDDPLPAFRANRVRIETVAARLIEESRFESDGTLLIRSADL
jgi:Protein of unknown function (DUF1488)